jgi:hypothetical protein
MAQKRAPIVTVGLEDANVPLTPIRDHRTPVEASEREDAIGVKSFINGFSSIRPVARRERMIPYPVRLTAAQIASLERLKERGIVPAEFIREALERCIAVLENH